MKDKKLIRKEFREAVFDRDKYQCRCCNQIGKDRQGGDGWKKYHKKEPELFLDAHHIQNRNYFENGGYVIENGISLCDKCHLKAEKYHISNESEGEIGYFPEDFYKKINSSFEKALQKDAKNSY